MDLLEVPAVLAGLRLDRDHRDAEQIVAGPHRAVEIGAGVARREVDETELGVDGRCLPDGRAAVFPRVVVGGPRVVTDLAGARDRIERPAQLTGARVVRFDASAGSAVAARETRDDEPVVIERCRRDAEGVFGAFRLDRPDDGAARLIERHELAVELPRVDSAVADRHAAAHPAATNDRDVGIEVRLVAPADRARLDIEREDVVGARRDVNDAVVDDRLRLGGILTRRARAVQARTPFGLELRDVGAVDARQRRITLVVDVAAVGDPTVGGPGREVLGGERRSDCRSLFLRRARCRQQRQSRALREPSTLNEYALPSIPQAIASGRV